MCTIDDGLLLNVASSQQHNSAVPGRLMYLLHDACVWLMVYVDSWEQQTP
jgi:hypothetical protein